MNGIGCGWHVIIQDDLTSGTDDALSFDGIQAEGDYFGEYCGLIEGPDQNTMVTINPTSAGGATTGGGVIKADVTSATPGLVIVRNIIFGANWTSEDLLDCANDGMLLAVNVDTSVPTIVGSGDNAITSHNNCKLGVIGYRGATKTTATGAMIAVTGASDAFVFDPTAWLQHNFDSAGVDAVNITAGSGELTLVGGTITSNGTTNSVQGIELAGGNSTTPTLRAARVMVGNLAGSGSEALRIMPDGTSEVASYIGYGNSWTSGAFNTQDGLAGPVAPGAGSNVNIFEVGSAYQLNTGPLLDFVAGYDCTGSDTLNITYAAYDEDPGTVLYNWNGTTSATQSTPTGCTALFETGSQEMGGAGTEGRPFRVNSPLYQLQAGNPAAGALTPNYHSIDPPPGNLKIPFQVEHLFPGYSLGQLALDNERAGAK